MKKVFEVGKTYYAWTQKGDIRLMRVTARNTDGTAIKAIYHNNNEKVMKIKGVIGEDEWVEADTRYKVVVTAEEYKEPKTTQAAQEVKQNENIKDLQKKLGKLLLPRA